MKYFLLALLLAGCGKEGPAGSAGPTGPSGEAGQAGTAGKDGASAAFKSVLFCQATLQGLGTSIWDNVNVTYQRVVFTSGDVMISVLTAGAGSMNENSTAYYDVSMSGAKEGKITVAKGDADYLIFYAAPGDDGYNDGLAIVSAGTDSSASVKDSLKCTLTKKK